MTDPEPLTFRHEEDACPGCATKRHRLCAACSRPAAAWLDAGAHALALCADDYRLLCQLRAEIVEARAKAAKPKPGKSISKPSKRTRKAA